MQPLILTGRRLQLPSTKTVEVKCRLLTCFDYLIVNGDVDNCGASVPRIGQLEGEYGIGSRDENEVTDLVYSYIGAVGNLEIVSRDVDAVSGGNPQAKSYYCIESRYAQGQPLQIPAAIIASAVFFIAGLKLFRYGLYGVSYPNVGLVVMLVGGVACSLGWVFFLTAIHLICPNAVPPPFSLVAAPSSSAYPLLYGARLLCA
jgi:hypothetical protein